MPRTDVTGCGPVRHGKHLGQLYGVSVLKALSQTGQKIQ